VNIIQLTRTLLSNSSIMALHTRTLDEAQDDDDELVVNAMLVSWSSWKLSSFSSWPAVSLDVA